MNLFRAYTYSWWQMGVFKVSLLAIGMILGASLASVVLAWLWVFVVLAVISTIYVVVASLTGANERRV
jgi:MFS family permease